MNNVFHHRGSMGDIIYSLPSVIALGGGDYCIWKKKGDNSKKSFNNMKRLLEIQPYIESVRNEESSSAETIDLDKFRKIERRNFFSKRFVHLSVCHLEAVGASFNLRDRWIFNIEPVYVDPVIVSRSKRYRNEKWFDDNISIIIKYINSVSFIGNDGDYNEFVKKIGIKVKRHICRDALDIAMAIKGSNLFIGNQSLGFAIAEGLKHKRVLEFYQDNPNCMPNGDLGFLSLDTEMMWKAVDDWK